MGPEGHRMLRASSTVFNWKETKAAFTHCHPSILLPGANITEFKSTLKSTSKTEKAYARTRTHTHTHTHAPLCKKRFHGDETEKQHRRRRATETAIINLKN